MTQDDEHSTLAPHASRLISRVEGMNEQIVPGRVQQYQHIWFAARSRQLADHLRAALLLSSASHYASAFVTVRAALEHHLLDRLLFLADRWVESYRVSKAREAAEDEKLRARALLGVALT